MSTGSDLTTAVLDATRPKLEELVVAVKDNFVADFGDWVRSEHRARLETVFLRAAMAKLDVYTAKTATAAHEFQEIYETLVADLETLGLDVKILAESEARRILVLSATRLIDLIPVVAGAVVKVGLGFVPGAGAIVGPIAGAGVEYLIQKLLA